MGMGQRRTCCPLIIPAANRIDLVDLPDQGRPALGWDALLFLWKFFGAEGIIEGEAKMTNQQLLARIVLDPKVMVGKPVIRGTRRRKECVFSLNI
jgi:hypothetical protein